MVHTQKDPGFLGRITPPVVITPSSFANLQRWYDSDYYTGQGKVDGNLLANTDTWFDNSTNAAVATPRNTAKPVFKTNIFSTGKPSVRFASSALMTHTATITWAGDFTVIYVCKNANDTILIGMESQNYQVRSTRNGINVNSFYPNGGSELISSTLGTAIGNAKANTWIRTGGVMKFWENAASFGTGSNAGTYTTNIIGLDDGGPLNSCDVGSIVFYSSALPDVDYLSLYNNYLKTRFGLP